jgi:hypothetical protein
LTAFRGLRQHGVRFPPSPGVHLRFLHAAVLAVHLLLLAGGLAASTLPAGFQETTIFAGLTLPTAVKFASDGRVFVAEKSGVIKVYASLSATTPTVFADLRPKVFDYWDRGLLGLELDPEFPSRPYVYVLYTLDKNPADPSAVVPTWSDLCPTPPGPMASGCPALGRLSRLDASAPWPVQASEHVLLESFPQQSPSHSIGGRRRELRRRGLRPARRPERKPPRPTGTPQPPGRSSLRCGRPPDSAERRGWCLA